jgi:hypothetical protein
LQTIVAQALSPADLVEAVVPASSKDKRRLVRETKDALVIEEERKKAVQLV